MVENNFESVVPTDERCNIKAVEVETVMTEKKGADIGPKVAYLPMGEETFARVVNPAPTEHGMGVATVALGYD